MSESHRPSVPKAQDEGRLAELGYTQELRREWSLLHNLGASFSIIVSLLELPYVQLSNALNVVQSVITGITTYATSPRQRADPILINPQTL